MCVCADLRTYTKYIHTSAHPQMKTHTLVLSYCLLPGMETMGYKKEGTRQ